MNKIKLAAGLIAVGGLIAPSVRTQGEQLDTDRIAEIVGRTGSYNATEGVYKVAIERTDVSVGVDGRTLHPFCGLTSWAAFQPGKRAEAMIMGDLVLFQDEVNPVMSAALENGLTVTALHNHFFYDDPKAYFMHIGGEGTTEGLAHGVRAALHAVRLVRETAATPATGFGYPESPTKSVVDGKRLEEILGVSAQSKDGMHKFVFGRSITMACGCQAGAGMGVNTWAVFAGSDERCIVDGDFACLAGELQTTLKALRKSGINIVAIHNHMEDEEPRTIFLHYWGAGPAESLAKAIRATLDVQSQVAVRATDSGPQNTVVGE